MYIGSRVRFIHSFIITYAFDVNHVTVILLLLLLLTIPIVSILEDIASKSTKTWREGICIHDFKF